jgi:acetyl-CoA carboxylase carboxyl transferase subunit beta
MALFEKSGKFRKRETDAHRVTTEGQFLKCPECQATLFIRELEENRMVCPRCRHHLKIYSLQRLQLLFDDGQFEEFDSDLRSPDPLHFIDQKEYHLRLADAYRKTSLLDAVRCGQGRMGGLDVIAVAMDYQFIGGSMGSVVGEKITRAIERALERRMPIVIVSASGGARMMEGILSLMQMAKISAALARIDEAGIPYFSVLTDPTTGGVTASFAMLGDLNIAEPDALIGFAGPRVIEQTIRQKLPEGFQRADFLLKHGMLDKVVPRADMRDFLIKALRFFTSP